MDGRIRASPEQFAALIAFMESHFDLCRPQSPGPQGRMVAEQLWLELTDKLNSISSGVRKTPDKWRRVWSDWKTKTKKKALHLRNQKRNNCDQRSQRLSRLEDRVLTVMSKHSNYNTEIPPSIEQLEIKPDLPVQDSDVEIKIEEIVGHSPTTECVESPFHQQLSLSPPQYLPATQTPPQLSPTPPPTSPLPHQPQYSAAASGHRPEPLRSRMHSPNDPKKLLKSPRLQRRRRRPTPFDRATSEFVAVELRRLELDELRERNLQEERVERRQLDARRINLDSEITKVFQGLQLLLEKFLHKI